VPEQIGCLVSVSAFLCDAGWFFFLFVLFGFSLGLPLANLRRLVSMALVKVSMDLGKVSMDLVEVSMDLVKGLAWI
jgi:hypothetical protein